MKIFVTDYDGTLADDNGRVSEYTIEQLRRLGDKKLIRVIATGRNLFSLKTVINDDFPIDYVIFSSGIGIYDWKKKTLLHHNSIDSKTTKEIYEYLVKNNYDFMVQLTVPENHYFHCFSTKEPSGDFLSRIMLYESKGIHTIKECPEKASQFVVICEDPDHYEKLKNVFTDMKVVRATSPIDKKSVWVEILPAGVSKASGIAFLQSRHTVEMANIIVVGNDYYDLDMLQFVNPKNAYVVSNAPYELKVEYKETGSNMENGVAKLIESFFLTNKNFE
ncbi:MAG TPA: HAD family hydrolase [Bacteroidales bacterium]|nr:HAD family hydrolase [Bacteroidales bacterium]